MGAIYSYFFTNEDLTKPLLPTINENLRAVRYNKIPYSLLSPTQSKELESMSEKVKRLLGLV